MRHDLSAACFVNQTLWLGSDETTHLEALTLTEFEGRDHRSLVVTDFLPLPDGKTSEIDIEGITYAEPYLWLVGSHSLKRKQHRPDCSNAENLKRLDTVVMEKNRYLLGRIPLVDGQLCRSCLDPGHPSRTLTAAALKWKKQGNQLTQALGRDPQFRPYLQGQIPGKENGFDIEGMVWMQGRLFLGLRGPVLRGWAVLLEVQLADQDPGVMKLVRIGAEGQRYRKYFLDLQGLGIRDLCGVGDDLLILAGPTLDMAGHAMVFRLSQALTALQSPFLTPTPLLTISDRMTTDKAEALTLLTDDIPSILVVYDSPGPKRLDLDDSTVLADIFALP